MVTRYRRSERPLAAEVDSEVLLFDPSEGMYFATSGVGALVWEALSVPRTEEELCKIVRERYDVPAEVCATDVAAFIVRLHAANLVEGVSDIRS